MINAYLIIKFCWPLTCSKSKTQFAEHTRNNIWANRAAESESEPESESVGVGCFPRSRSRSRSRQNLPTPTDSGQALIPDSQKSPCWLFKTFCSYFCGRLAGWLIPNQVLRCSAYSRDGNRSKFRTQAQPGPDIWKVSFLSGRGIDDRWQNRCARRPGV